MAAKLGRRMSGVAMALLLALLMVSVEAQVRCGKKQRRTGGLLLSDCEMAVQMLNEDEFTVLPNRYMEEMYGSCRARVYNAGGHPVKFYRDTVSLEFDDIILECVRLNGHPGSVLTGNNILYTLTSTKKKKN